MTLTETAASNITEALERAAALHDEVLQRVRELLEAEEPITALDAGTLDVQPAGR
jgi:hypothetical protein